MRSKRVLFSSPTREQPMFVISVFEQHDVRYFEKFPPKPMFVTNVRYRTPPLTGSARRARAKKASSRFSKHLKAGEQGWPRFWHGPDPFKTNCTLYFAVDRMEYLKFWVPHVVLGAELESALKLWVMSNYTAFSESFWFSDFRCFRAECFHKTIS